MNTGIITTTIGVLFKNADIAKTPMQITASDRFGRTFTWRSASWVARSKAPVRTSAPEITNIAAIVQGAELDRAVATSPCGAIPRTSIRQAPPMAVTSTG